MNKKMIIVLVMCLGVSDLACRKEAKTSAGKNSDPANSGALSSQAGKIIFAPESPLLNQFAVESVRTMEMPVDEISAPGQIEFVNGCVSFVSLPVPGRIDRVHVRQGDTVVAGQPLFTIDSPDADAFISDFRQAQATVNQARSALTKAKADSERAVDLFEHKAVAKKEVLASENERTQAQASLDQSEAVLVRARRRLEIIGLNESEAGQKVTVRSPLSGKVINLSITAGEYRNETTVPAMTVADLSTVCVTSEVPETSIRFIEVGERIQVELVAYPGEIFEARVARISDTVDPSTRTIQVRAELPNPRGKLRPEMFGRIHHSHPPRSMPVIPSRAVLHRGSEAVVYIERSRGTFERVPIRIGKASGDHVPVLAGLKSGDRVVVEGVMLLAGTETH
jgi:cobalt-zinc-cadmium efflux system membrane fusion protein